MAMKNEHVRQHNEALPLLIERARKEERRIRYFEAFLGTLTPLSALALAFSVAHRAGVEGAHTLPLALLLVALVIFPSLVLAFRRRPSALALARTLDHHHRLDSVLANGIELKGNDPFSRLERARAEAAALGVDPREAFRLSRPRGLIFAPLFIAVALSITLWPRDGEVPFTSIDEALDESEPLLSSDSAAALKELLEARHAGRNDAHPIVDELSELVTMLEEGGITRGEAIERIAAMDTSLAPDVLPSAAPIEEGLRTLGSAMESALNQRTNARATRAGEEFIKALQVGALGSAAEEARALAEALEAERLSPMDQRALGRAFEAAARSGRSIEAGLERELERIRNAEQRRRSRLLDGDEAKARMRQAEEERRRLETLRREQERLQSEKEFFEEITREMEELTEEVSRGNLPVKRLLKMAKLLDRLGVDLERFRDTELARRMMEQLRAQLRGDESDALRRSLLEEFAERARKGTESFGAQLGGIEHGDASKNAQDAERDAASQGETGNPDAQSAAHMRQDGAEGTADPERESRRGGSSTERTSSNEAASFMAQGGSDAPDERGAPTDGAATPTERDEETARPSGATQAARAIAARQGDAPGQGHAPMAGSGAGDSVSAGSIASNEPLDSRYEDRRVDGILTKPPSRSETILTARAAGFVGEAYQRVHADYSQHAETVIESEEIPPGYRHSIRRYFQLIRPRGE